MQNFCLKILDFGSSHSSSAPIGASREKLRPAKTSSQLRNARAPTFRSYTVTYSATQHILGGAVKKAFFSFKIEIYSNKCNLKCRKMVKCNKFFAYSTYRHHSFLIQCFDLHSFRRRLELSAKSALGRTNTFDSRLQTRDFFGRSVL